MFGDVLAFFQLYDRFKNKFLITQRYGQDSSLSSRFFALFESHGVHRNQIPEFFGHGLDISSCDSERELLKKLTPDIITDAAELFGINKDWLEGSSAEIYDIPDFYKHPEEFESYLSSLLERTSANRLSAYALSVRKNKMNPQNDSLLIIAEPIGELNQREIYKHHLLGRWGIHYWKSRAYFTACCALLYKHGFLVVGKYVQRDWLSEVCGGQKLLKYDFTERNGGVDFPTKGSWIVSEFVEMPDKYLNGIDTERGHAVNLALDMWLSLSENGFMRCFPEDDDYHAGVEKQFEKKIRTLVLEFKKQKRNTN